MFVDPTDAAIIEQLNELRIWLDGFLADRVMDDPELGEVWPYAITGDHNDALELTINWLKERAERKGKPNDK